MTWTKAWVVGLVALAGVDVARSAWPTRPPEMTPDAFAALRDPLDPMAALVTVTDADGERACARREDRHQCGPKGWQYVGRKKMKVAGKRKTCIWAHPLDGATTRVTYPSVRSTKDAPLTLRFGLADRVSRKGGPVEVEVAFAGETTTHTHAPHRGWSRVALGEGSGPLRIAISADEVGQRHFCFRFD